MLPSAQAAPPAQLRVTVVDQSGGAISIDTAPGRGQGNGGNAGSNATFTLCDGRGPAKARALIMGNAGTLRDGVATQANLDATCPR